MSFEGTQNENSNPEHYFQLRSVGETGLKGCGHIPIEVQHELDGITVPVKEINSDEFTVPRSIRVSALAIAQIYEERGDQRLAGWWQGYANAHMHTSGKETAGHEGDIMLPFSSGYLQHIKIPNEA